MRGDNEFTAELTYQAEVLAAYAMKFAKLATMTAHQLDMVAVIATDNDAGASIAHINLLELDDAIELVLAS